MARAGSNTVRPRGEANLVGRNFVARRVSTAAWRRTGAAVLVGLVVGGMLLVSLRMAIVRSRYALADAAATETALMAAEREAAVTLREMRDPRRLTALAEAQGFVRPERVVELGSEATAP